MRREVGSADSQEALPGKGEVENRWRRSNETGQHVILLLQGFMVLVKWGNVGRYGRYTFLILQQHET